MGAEQQQRVIQRPGSLRLPLIDADRAQDRVAAASVDDPIHQWPGHVDRLMPQPLPKLVLAAERCGLPGPSVRRLQRHKCLGEHRELHALSSGIGEQANGLIDTCARVEDHRRRLNRGDANGRKVDHAAQATPPCLS